MRRRLGTAALCFWVCAGANAGELAIRRLTNFKAVYEAARHEARSRSDCIAWYDFAKLPPPGFRFIPGPGKGKLTAVEGRWPGQAAMHIFYGKLLGKALHISDSGFTVCFWLRVHKVEKIDRQGYKRSNGGVMAVGSGYYGGWRVTARPGGAAVGFTIGGPKGGVRGVSSAGYVAKGKWSHVAITWDRKTLCLWVDGKLRARAPASIPYTPEPKRPGLRIGECDYGVGVLDFDIADLGIFGSALPADLLRRLGAPEGPFREALAAFLTGLAPAERIGEEAYRRQFESLFALEDVAAALPAYRAARARARLLIARSYRREGRTKDARRAYAELAAAPRAPLHCRARAMLAIGDLYRDARNYTAARKQYEKMREFFTGKHEEFRVEAIERLEDIATLRDGAPFRAARQRRIDRISHPARRFYTAPGGDDGNPGTRTRPFRTLERARDAVRALKKQGPLPRGGVAVVLRGGIYRRETRSFALGAEDSGTPEAPVIYMAAPGERPILRGGQVIRNFVPLKDPAGKARIPKAAQPHVLQVDLRAEGVTDFGKITPRGKGTGAVTSPDVPAHLELFFNGKPMPLARWPNDAPTMSERTARIDLRGQKTERDRGRTVARGADFFTYANPRQDAWAGEPDGWLYGCWQWLYFASYKHITRVDPEKRRIYFDWNCKTPYQRKRRGLIQGSWYMGVNLLCELDTPGEWYLDRRSGILFFWPPADLSKGEAVVSVLEKPLIALDNVSDVVFRGLTLEAGRLHGVVIQGGARVLLAGCIIRDLGVSGVIIDGGRRHEIVGCDIAWTGDSGIELSGGDPETLTPSGHLIENCHIHHFARWNRVGYEPAVHLRGVGARVSHCLVHDAPHQAFLADGNDHVVEFSEIHDVVTEAGDAGAFYMYGDSVAKAQLERGNVVRFNYWHDLPQTNAFKGVSCTSRMGIYIDNFNGAITVYGNIFHRIDFSAGAVFFGTNDDFVENNIFHRCYRAVCLTDRTWLYDKVNKPPKYVIDATLAKAAANPVWARRYPRLTTFPRRAKDTSPFLEGNVIARNIVSQCDAFTFGSARTIRLARIERNWMVAEPGFRDPDHGDFRLPADSPAMAVYGFDPIPVKKIGLYRDELRATWPVKPPCGN